MRTLNPLNPLNNVIGMFTKQAETQLLLNVRTQHVWPTEIYSGFGAINEMRRRRRQWNATGKGAKSFKGTVVSADSPDNVTVVFSFNDYMQYVDIGVGAGTSAEDVERAKNAKYKSRYTSKWNRREGRSHRPAIMPEMRHLERRIQRYLTDYYGYEGELWIGAIEHDGSSHVKVKIKNS